MIFYKYRELVSLTKHLLVFIISTYFNISYINNRKATFFLIKIILNSGHDVLYFIYIIIELINS